MIAHDTRLLVVDDHNAIRMALKRLLRSVGFNSVETAKNGKEALEMLKNEGFGCIISDYNMPMMNGYELLVEIREHQAKSIPFVLMSSRMDDALMASALQAGATACLSKGNLTIETLVELLGRI